MIEREKVRLSGVAETTLATLYGKAVASRAADPVLVDLDAEGAVERLDYDFARLGVSRDSALAIALRSAYFDRWTREALSDHPDATVLHLGCGLDCRARRVDPPPGVRWYDVDRPEVIELRRRLYGEHPGHHTIGGSVTDPRWLARVPADRPGVVVAEGMVQYLTEAEGVDLFTRIVERFPRGVVMFDACSSLAMRLGRHRKALRATGARPGGWGIDDPATVESLVPGLRLGKQQAFLGVPEMARFGWQTRLAVALTKHFPAAQKTGRLVRYDF
ncbi:class I SAM-dependent methyltransferase [Actinomadura sp. NAK00032]|uniref:class I SAM-dependent methyltransferase n=1 Tax=Actinomadura sp. NAK00032 TaxID=2742128 RepID=UPI0015928CAC|nr:class I SAM-dependent methyltransferase [Actinomadura sp. NAK00032]QKW38415.1 class I SAM-dependent methyltransferase [Actinomadura sp. NAK00032]